MSIKASTASLRRANHVRLFKLNCGPDTWAVCETATYEEITRRALHAHPSLADAIIHAVLPSHTESAVAGAALLQRLASAGYVRTVSCSHVFCTYRPHVHRAHAGLKVQSATGRSLYLPHDNPVWQAS